MHWYRIAFAIVIAQTTIHIRKQYVHAFLTMDVDIIDVIFPIFMGIDGIMYAGPVADFLAALIAATLLTCELKKMGK